MPITSVVQILNQVGGRMEIRRVGWGERRKRRRVSLPPLYVIWLTREGRRDDDREVLNGGKTKFPFITLFLF